MAASPKSNKLVGSGTAVIVRLPAVKPDTRMGTAVLSFTLKRGCVLETAIENVEPTKAVGPTLKLKSNNLASIPEVRTGREDGIVVASETT